MRRKCPLCGRNTLSKSDDDFECNKCDVIFAGGMILGGTHEEKKESIWTWENKEA